MKRKVLLSAIPALILPYVALLSLALIFFSSKVAIFDSVMENVFNNNGLLLIGVLLLFFVISAVLSVVFFVISIRNGWNALSLAKTAMIVKLIQIPAYVLIFILGVLLAITIFTLPFVLLLFLVDCFSLFSSGAIAVSAMINSVKQGEFKLKEVIGFIISQFIFCADVVMAIVFYKKLKRKLEISEN